MKPFDKERLIREFLEKMFGASLKKRKLVIGYDTKNKPQIHEFDLVSDDMSIVGEIKSGSKSRNNFTRALADCFFLDKVEKCRKKLLVLTSKEFYGYFKAHSEGLISSEIDVVLVPIEDLAIRSMV